MLLAAMTYTTLYYWKYAEKEFSMFVDSIFWLMEWWKEIYNIPSVKPFGSNKSTKQEFLTSSNVQVSGMEMYANKHMFLND